MPLWYGAGCALALLLAAASMACAQARTEWRDASDLSIEGRGWQDCPTPYCRLPVRAQGSVTPSVWDLSHHSAGLAVRFVTDSPTVSVRWTVISSGLAMPHMPATGVSGVDLYARSAAGHWEFVQNGRPEAQSSTVVCELGGGELRECLLYLPLYNGVKRLEVGVPAGKQLEAAPPRPSASARPIVVYGTSIVQGGCASRPGMAWTAIVGRMLDRPVINLGFSGSGLMEPGIVSLMAELDPEVYVIDSLWNMGGLDDAVLRERIENAARTLRRARPTTPIVFVGRSDIRCAPTNAPSRGQEAVVRKLRAEGMHGLTLVSGRRLLGSDAEGTVDGAHPNDLGMMRQAEALAPVLRRVLRAKP